MNIKNTTKIGGEFEIDPKNFSGYENSLPSDRQLFFSSGRSALMAILKNIAQTNPRIIHIPYYICHSVVNACIFAGFEVCFYELDERFFSPIDYSKKIKKGESLLTVNYFGFVDDNPIIESIKQIRPDIITISDHSQSFWTYKQSRADYSFTSLRKHFSVPDGAFIHAQQALPENKFAIPVNLFYYSKLLGSILKFLKQEDKLYLDLFAEGENILNTEYNITQTSNVTRFLLEKINFEHIKERRRNNTQIVYELGEKAGLQFVFDYNEDVIPLNVPVLLNDRDHIRSSMIKKNIFLPIHWPVKSYNSSSKHAKQMASNSLSLIIDQRYGYNEMNFQLNVLINLAG